MTSVNLDAVLVKERVVVDDFASGIYYTRIVDWAVDSKGWVRLSCEIIKTPKSKSALTTVPHTMFNDKDIAHLRSCMFYRQFEFSGKTTRDFLNSLKGSIHRIHASLEPEDDRYPESDTNPLLIRINFNSKYKK